MASKVLLKGFSLPATGLVVIMRGTIGFGAVWTTWSMFPVIDYPRPKLKQLSLSIVSPIALDVAEFSNLRKIKLPKRPSLASTMTLQAKLSMHSSL